MVLFIFVIMATKVKSAKAKASAKETFKTEKEQKVAVKHLLKDERTHKIAGTVFLLLAFLFFIAFSSYLFTWDEDQDKFSYRMLLANDIKVQNLLGTFGAFISEIFIRHGFGIASYLICTFFFVLGVNLFFGKKVFSVPRNLKYLIVGLPLVSVTAAVIMNGNKFPFGGSAGDTSRDWLYHIIGKVGTLSVLAVAMIAYIIWRFNPVFKLPSKNTLLTEEEAGEEDEEQIVAPVIATADTTVSTPETRRNILKGDGAMLTVADQYDSLSNHNFQIIEKDIPLTVTNTKKDAPQKEIIEDFEELSANYALPPKPVKKNEDAAPLELEIKSVPEKVAKEDQPSLGVKHQTIDTPYDPILDL
ncbi:MAG: DNA translocase FtsK 4TM domain-containing protein, partial [Aquabacterium sp.]|nr:DNA translocase FtsK 4TM domain-containing protein [Ferruginibacter sp.]